MKPIHGLYPVILALLCAACDDGRDGRVVGTSTETVTGKTTGIIRLADGKPAVGAKVRVYPVGYRPLQDSNATVAFKTSTDDNGRYYIDSLEAHEYNILSDLKGQAGYLDSVSLPGTSRNLASLTLEDPGILCGRIALQPGDLPSAASVQVLGTQAFANVDDDGFFELPALAPGQYRAVVTVALANYNILFATVQVRSGKRDTLAEALKPKFTSIPQVTGLKASFDTLNQRVFLSWNQTRYPEFMEYLIYRHLKGSVNYSSAPIARVQDTFFVDRLRGGPDVIGEGTGMASQWEYSVAIFDKLKATGRTYGNLTVDTPPMEMVVTQIFIQTLNTRAGDASIGDTVLLVADYGNPTRNLKLLRWFREGQSAPLRTVTLDGLGGLDTLRFICPRDPGFFRFRIEIADGSGSEWSLQTHVNTLLDAPTLSMLPNVSGSAGQSLRVQAPVHEDLGHIVKMEWDIGGSGNWIESKGNDTVITLPNSGIRKYDVVFRATDDDGLIAVDTTAVYVSPWLPLAPLPLARRNHSAVGLGGVVYVMGGNGPDGNAVSRFDAYDTATGRWSVKAPMLSIRSHSTALTYQGRIYVFGGNDGTGRPMPRCESYDPSTNTWTALPDMPGVRNSHAAILQGGRFFVFGGESYSLDNRDRMKAVDVFDPATGTWSTFDTDLPWEHRMTAVTAGGVNFVFSRYFSHNGEFSRFDPVANTWSPLETLPFRKDDNGYILAEFSVANVAGKIVVHGGEYDFATIGSQDTRYPVSDTHVFNPLTATWSESLPLLGNRIEMETVAIGESQFLVGGRNPWLSGSGLDNFDRAPAP